MTKSELEQKLREKALRDVIEHVVRKAVLMAREEKLVRDGSTFGYDDWVHSHSTDEILAEILKDMEQGNE